MITDYFKLAWKSLSHRRLRSYLTMIGIVIGVAAIVALISLGQGLETAVVSQFNVAGSTDIISVQAQGSGNGPPGTGVSKPLTQDDVDKINQIAGVDIAIGRLIESGSLEFNNKLTFGYGASMPDGEARKAVEEIGNLQIEKGRMLKDGDRKKIVVGSQINSDELADFFGKRIEVGSKVLVQGEQFQVIGVLKKKGSFLTDSTLLFNEQDLRDLFDIQKGEFSLIAVKVKNVDDIPKIKEDISKYLRKERNVDVGEEDFTVQTPDQAIENLKSTLFAVTLFLYIIAGISVLVGGIGITNTMYTAVLERTKEIGIMKAVGGSRKAIFSLFFIESGLLGMVGGIVGVLFGIGIASGLVALASSFLGDLIQASYSPLLIIGAILFSFIIGTLAGILPALQASKLHPVDALNYAK